MLKELQKVRDILEEVTQIYVETTELYEALKKEGDADDNWFVFASDKATEIILEINDMIYKDVGYFDYFKVHDKIMYMLSFMIAPRTQCVKDWLFHLIMADNAAIQSLIFV